MQKISKIAITALLTVCGAFSVNAFAENSTVPDANGAQRTHVTKMEDNQISINSASAEELAAALSGIGLKKAQDIVNYREQYGAFTHIEQLQEVSGIGAAILERNLNKVRL